MSVIKVRVDNERISIVEEGTTEFITSGNMGTLGIEFDFSAEWHGYTKTAVLYVDKYDSETAVEKILTNDRINEEDLPSDLIAEKCTLYIGVFGDNVNGQRITADVCGVDIIKGVHTAQIKKVVNVDIYNQIINKMTKCVEIAQSIRDDADNGEFDGKDYILTEQDKQEIENNIKNDVLLPAENDRNGTIKLNGNTFQNTTMTGNTSINGENAYINVTEIAALGNADTKNAQINGKTINQNANNINIIGTIKVNIVGNTEISGNNIILGSATSNMTINGNRVTCTAPTTFAQESTFNRRVIINSALLVQGKETVENVNVKHSLSVSSTDSNTFSSNSESIAAGKGNNIQGKQSIAVGQWNEINGSAINSVVVGFKNNVSSSYSLVVGEGNQSKYPVKGQLIAGAYNDDAGVDDLLVLGNGYYDDDGNLVRQNALTVNKDGTIKTFKEEVKTESIQLIIEEVGNSIFIEFTKYDEIRIITSEIRGASSLNLYDENRKLVNQLMYTGSMNWSNDVKYSCRELIEEYPTAIYLSVNSGRHYEGIAEVTSKIAPAMVGYYNQPEIDAKLSLKADKNEWELFNTYTANGETGGFEYTSASGIKAKEIRVVGYGLTFSAASNINLGFRTSANPYSSGHKQLVFGNGVVKDATYQLEGLIKRIGENKILVSMELWDERSVATTNVLKRQCIFKDTELFVGKNIVYICSTVSAGNKINTGIVETYVRGVF